MPTPHKHRDVIIAWANGEQIQWRNSFSSYWRDWEGEQTPAFGIPDNAYRIKPKTVVRFMAIWQVNGRLCNSGLYKSLEDCKKFWEKGPAVYHRVVLEDGKIISCEEVK